MIKQSIEQNGKSQEQTEFIYIYIYSLTKFGNDYHLRLDGEHEKFYCVFSMIDGDICIECGERDGKKLKAESRLKAFSQIVLSMWGLIQVGKIS